MIWFLAQSIQTFSSCKIDCRRCWHLCQSKIDSSTLHYPLDWLKSYVSILPTVVKSRSSSQISIQFQNKPGFHVFIFTSIHWFYILLPGKWRIFISHPHIILASLIVQLLKKSWNITQYFRKQPNFNCYFLKRFYHKYCWFLQSVSHLFWKNWSLKFFADKLESKSQKMVQTWIKFTYLSFEFEPIKFVNSSSALLVDPNFHILQFHGSPSYGALCFFALQSFNRRIRVLAY